MHTKVEIIERPNDCRNRESCNRRIESNARDRQVCLLLCLAGCRTEVGQQRTPSDLGLTLSLPDRLGYPFGAQVVVQATPNRIQEREVSRERALCGAVDAAREWAGGMDRSIQRIDTRSCAHDGDLFDCNGSALSIGTRQRQLICSRALCGRIRTAYLGESGSSKKQHWKDCDNFLPPESTQFHKTLSPYASCRRKRMTLSETRTIAITPRARKLGQTVSTPLPFNMTALAMTPK